MRRAKCLLGHSFFEQTAKYNLKKKRMEKKIPTNSSCFGKPLIYSLQTTGSQPVNEVQPVLHLRMNTVNHTVKAGTFLNARLKLPDGAIPKRGNGRSEDANQALEDAERELKAEAWDGPADIGIGKPDPTGW